MWGAHEWIAYPAAQSPGRCARCRFAGRLRFGDDDGLRASMQHRFKGMRKGEMTAENLLRKYECVPLALVDLHTLG